jgi:hypothetical protein
MQTSVLMGTGATAATIAGPTALNGVANSSMMVSHYLKREA